MVVGWRKVRRTERRKAEGGRERERKANCVSVGKLAEAPSLWRQWDRRQGIYAESDYRRRVCGWSVIRFFRFSISGGVRKLMEWNVVQARCWRRLERGWRQCSKVDVRLQMSGAGSRCWRCQVVPRR